MENAVYILDHLPSGRQTERGFHREAVALGVGETELKLLELIPRPGGTLTAGTRIPLAAATGTPSPIDHVRRRIGYDELTTSARTELEPTLERIVLADAPRRRRRPIFAEHFLRRPGAARRRVEALSSGEVTSTAAAHGSRASMRAKRSPHIIVSAGQYLYVQMARVVVFAPDSLRHHWQPGYVALPTARPVMAAFSKNPSAGCGFLPRWASVGVGAERARCERGMTGLIIRDPLTLRSGFVGLRLAERSRGALRRREMPVRLRHHLWLGGIGHVVR